MLPDGGSIAGPWVNRFLAPTSAVTVGAGMRTAPWQAKWKNWATT